MHSELIGFPAIVMRWRKPNGEKSKFSESTIVTLLKGAETSTKVADICREHDIKTATFYQWRSKYGGMETSDIKLLRELQEENEKLKLMYAEMALENRALKDLLEKIQSCRSDIGRPPCWLTRAICQLQRPAS